jgi:hypothetical protein
MNYVSFVLRQTLALPSAPDPVVSRAWLVEIGRCKFKDKHVTVLLLPE